MNITSLSEEQLHIAEKLPHKMLCRSECIRVNQQGPVVAAPWCKVEKTQFPNHSYQTKVTNFITILKKITLTYFLISSTRFATVYLTHLHDASKTTHSLHPLFDINLTEGGLDPYNNLCQWQQTIGESGGGERGKSHQIIEVLSLFTFMVRH